MNRDYSIPIPSRYLPRKIPNWIPNWRVSVSLSMRLCTLRIGIHFLKDPGFRALAGLRDPFDDLCCVEGISIWSDRLRKARGSAARELAGKVYRKDSSFLLVLDWDSLVIPAQWVLSCVIHFWHQSYIFSLWTEEKGGSAGRLYHERSKEINLFQIEIYNMNSGNDFDSRVDTNESSFPRREIFAC